MLTWTCCAVPRLVNPIVIATGSLPVSRSAVAARMASMRGLHLLMDVNISTASFRSQPRSQYMYARAVAGARPSPDGETATHRQHSTVLKRTNDHST